MDGACESLCSLQVKPGLFLSVSDILSLFPCSITLHFKFSCPASRTFDYSQNPGCLVPQVKIEMEPDWDFSDPGRDGRKVGGETAL